MRVSSDRVQIGYQNYRWLGFGFSRTSPTSNQSQWGIDHFDGGLNFWKPWPVNSHGNYKLFLSDLYGKVGIGIGSTPLWSRSLNWNWHALQIRGWGLADGWATYSDERLKTNFRPILNPIQKILALKAYQYDYNLAKMKADTMISDTTGSSANGYEPDKMKRQQDELSSDGMLNRYGFKAQEVQSILPDLVHNPISDSSGYKAMDYIGIVPILVEGFKAQQALIDSQNTIIAQLRQEIVNWQGRSIDTIGQSRSRLFQNTPNPFNGTTTISYFIDESTSVSNAVIEVRDIMGNLKTSITLADGSGIGQVQYDGSQLLLGYYIYTLKVNGGVKDSKMFLKEQ